MTSVLKNWKITDNSAFKAKVVDVLNKKENADILTNTKTMERVKNTFRKYLGLDKGAEKANQTILELINKSTRDHFNNSKNKLATANQLLFHLANQTNIGSGFYRGSATHMDVSMEAKRKSKEYRSEHGLQLLAFNTNFFVDVLRFEKDNAAFNNSYKELADMYRQGVITEAVREMVDYKWVDGKRIKTNTEVPEWLTRDMQASHTYLQNMGIASKQLYLGEGFLTKGQQILYNVAAGNIAKLSKQAVLPTKGITKGQMIENLRTRDKALGMGRSLDKKKRGLSTFDFDETVGVSDNYVNGRFMGKK